MLLLGFFYGLLGLVEVEFELFLSLVWNYIFVPPPDVTGKDVGIVN